MLETVEKAGRVRRLPRGPVLHAQVAQGGRGGPRGRDRRRDLGPLARDAPRAAQRVVLGRPADRRRRDHRPRLPLHRDHPQLRRQGEPAGRGAVPHRHARPPDRRRGQRRSRSSASSPGPSGSSRSAGRSGAGWTCATRWPGRTARSGSTTSCAPGFEMFTAGGGGGYVAEKAETSAGWLFPVGDEVVRARLRRHVHATCSAPSRRARRRRRRSTTATSSTRSWTPAIGRRRATPGSRWTSSGAAAHAAHRLEPETLRGQGRHQARDPARRPPQADPQGPRERRLHATGSWPAGWVDPVQVGRGRPARRGSGERHWRASPDRPPAPGCRASVAGRPGPGLGLLAPSIDRRLASLDVHPAEPDVERTRLIGGTIEA